MKTLETRDSTNNTLRRRRECAACGKRFTTYEHIQEIELMIRKKDGRLERFDADKIIRGLQKACEKRPVTLDEIRDMTEQVRQDTLSQGRDEVSSREIGDLVMDRLKEVDRVAYIRFASVYKAFSEPRDFGNVLREVRE
jgi:transcriptional repressor NrdR